MKSTGEVMGIDPDLGLAFAKSQMAAGSALPRKAMSSSASPTGRSRHRRIAQDFHDLGFTLFATSGTTRAIKAAGVPVKLLFKLAEGRRPHVLDMIKNGEIHFIINTPGEAESRTDEMKIRTAAIANRIPIMTTLRGASAASSASARCRPSQSKSGRCRNIIGSERTPSDSCPGKSVS